MFDLVQNQLKSYLKVAPLCDLSYTLSTTIKLCRIVVFISLIKNMWVLLCSVKQYMNLAGSIYCQVIDIFVVCILGSNDVLHNLLLACLHIV